MLYKVYYVNLYYLCQLLLCFYPTTFKMGGSPLFDRVLYSIPLDPFQIFKIIINSFKKYYKKNRRY